MDDYRRRSNQLSSREIQQLQLSLQSGSVREVALTVCTIRNLAQEVKSIIGDLLIDEVVNILNSTCILWTVYMYFYCKCIDAILQPARPLVGIPNQITSVSTPMPSYTEARLDYPNQTMDTGPGQEWY